MTSTEHFTVQWTCDSGLVGRVLRALGDEILFDEYPVIPEESPALTGPHFRCVVVKEDGVVLGLVLCVDFELHTLFLPGLRGARAIRAGREVLRFLWENTETPELRSYFYSHQPHVGLFARMLGFRAVPSARRPLHVAGDPVFRTDLILNRPS